MADAKASAFLCAVANEPLRKRATELPRSRVDSPQNQLLSRIMVRQGNCSYGKYIGTAIEANRRRGMGDKADIWHGTLALMVLKTLEGMGPLHGYGIARRIEQVSENLLALNYGT